MMRTQIRVLGAGALAILLTLVSTSAEARTPLAKFGPGMTVAQMQSMQKSLNQALGQAINAAKYKDRCDTGSCATKLTIDSSFNCPAGGAIRTTGVWVGAATRDSAQFAGSATQAILDWRCVSGWVVNGMPLVTQTGSLTSSSAHLAVSSSQSGSWQATGSSNANQVCRVIGSSAYSSAAHGEASVSTNCVPGGSRSVRFTF